MGKGVAFEFRKRFPAMFEDYVRRCESNAVCLGKPHVFRDPSGPTIVNFPTKGHWRTASRLQDIERGLDSLVAHVEEWGITDLALPALGCGNGRLSWSEVRPLICHKLERLPIDIELYAPYEKRASESDSSRKVP